MSDVDDLAATILSVTADVPAFPPASVLFPTITAARYLAPGMGEVEVQGGAINGTLPIPLRNCAGPFVTQLAANPTAMVGREVMVIVGSKRACIICVMGV